MIIEIAGGTYPAAGWWFILIPGAIVVLGIISLTIWGDREFLVGQIGLALAAIYALVFGVMVAPGVGLREEETQKVEALEEQGFENVDVDDDDSFTASRDGDYFSGSLLEIAENTYQVVEKVEVQ